MKRLGYTQNTLAYDTSSVRRALSLGLVFVAANLAAASAQPAKYLNIGDPAPALKPAKWLKGTPVKSFEAGKVYVVEFWATWCGPCKENIPHLTELAKKYKGQVAISGISIWESQDLKSTSYLAKVEKFVKGQGNKMVYNVAVDGPTQDVANAWMKPAGEEGIPCSFIIGKDQRVAWIGHPAEMETVLSKVIAGTFDVAAARAKRNLSTDVSRPINEALAAKDYKKTIELIDATIAKDPSKERYYAYPRLTSLFHVDFPKASEQADKILKESNGELGAYQMVISIFASGKDLSIPAYRYALVKSDEALTKGERKYMFLAMKAEILSSLGEFSEAIKTQESSIEEGAKDEHCPKEFLEFLKKNLVKIKDLAKAKGQ